MKITTGFRPVSLTITLETEGELEALYTTTNLAEVHGIVRENCDDKLAVDHVLGTLFSYLDDIV